MHQLQDGDFSVSASWKAILFNKNNDRFEFGYRAPKSKQFLVLLVGSIDKKEIDVDVVPHMRKIGWIEKPRSVTDAMVQTVCDAYFKSPSVTTPPEEDAMRAALAKLLETL